MRGKHGGVRLAQTPNQITLDKIYNAISDHKLICIPNKKAYKPCPVSCAMGGIMKKLSEKIEDSTILQLSKISLQDLLNDINR